MKPSLRSRSYGKHQEETLSYNYRHQESVATRADPQPQQPNADETKRPKQRTQPPSRGDEAPEDAGGGDTPRYNLHTSKGRDPRQMSSDDPKPRKPATATKCRWNRPHGAAGPGKGEKQEAGKPTKIIADSNAQC